MAAYAKLYWPVLKLLSLFVLFIDATTSENTTNYNFSVNVFGDQNATYIDMDNFTTTMPTGFDSTTPVPSSSTEEPVKPTLPAEPLPVSGRLLTPVFNVDSLCPCDEHRDVCDINCCCDIKCSEEVALFTGCSVDTLTGNKQLCSWDVASYTLQSTVHGYSELQSSVQKKTNHDIFCIQSQNRVDGLSHPPPALPTDSNFDSLFKIFTSFVFGSEENSGQAPRAESQALSGYQYGDVMITAGESGQTGLFRLPAPSITADCVDTNPAAFLKDQSSRCSRHVVLERDCTALPALNMDTYTNIQLFAGKNKDGAAIPPELDSVILQSVDGTQTELQMSGGENLSPVLLNPTLCANVVLKVVFVIKYQPGGEIVNVTVSLVVGFIHETSLPLQQEFHIRFVQQKDVTERYSGNPGYVVGLPVLSGTRTADGIARSINPRDTLSLLHSAEDQDCLRGAHKRSPVLFGVDSMSGCTIGLDDAANCSQVTEILLSVLRGPNYPQHVSSFGNSPLDSPMDWVPIKSNFNTGDTQSCSIPLSLHIEIEWTKYGSLVNPVARILSVKEIIQTNITSLALLSGGNNKLPVRSSVAFIPVSAAALPSYRAMPTINAKLASDFFFPFV